MSLHQKNKLIEGDKLRQLFELKINANSFIDAENSARLLEQSTKNMAKILGHNSKILSNETRQGHILELTKELRFGFDGLGFNQNIEQICRRQMLDTQLLEAQITHLTTKREKMVEFHIDELRQLEIYNNYITERFQNQIMMNRMENPKPFPRFDVSPDPELKFLRATAIPGEEGSEAAAAE